MHRHTSPLKSPWPRVLHTWNDVEVLQSAAIVGCILPLGPACRELLALAPACSSVRCSSLHALGTLEASLSAHPGLGRAGSCCLGCCSVSNFSDSHGGRRPCMADVDHMTPALNRALKC